MSRTLKLAVPSMGEGGMNAQRSGHFGHCDCFTIVNINDGTVEAVTTLANPPHEEGGCLRPVQMLADVEVDAIVAAGMGGRPLAGFNQAGITVYYDTENPQVEGAVQQIIAEKTPTMSMDNACQHHH